MFGAINLDNHECGTHLVAGICYATAGVAAVRAWVV
jgi:hypothetical protein